MSTISKAYLISFCLSFLIYIKLFFKKLKFQSLPIIFIASFFIKFLFYKEAATELTNFSFYAVALVGLWLILLLKVEYSFEMTACTSKMISIVAIMRTVASLFEIIAILKFPKLNGNEIDLIMLIIMPLIALFIFLFVKIDFFGVNSKVSSILFLEIVLAVVYLIILDLWIPKITFIEEKESLAILSLFFIIVAFFTRLAFYIISFIERNNATIKQRKETMNFEMEKAFENFETATRAKEAFLKILTDFEYHLEENDMECSKDYFSSNIEKEKNEIMLEMRRYEELKDIKFPMIQILLANAIRKAKIYDHIELDIKLDSYPDADLSDYELNDRYTYTILNSFIENAFNEAGKYNLSKIEISILIGIMVEFSVKNTYLDNDPAEAILNSVALEGMAKKAKALSASSYLENNYHIQTLLTFLARKVS